MNEMMYRKKLLNNIDALEHKIMDAFKNSTVTDTIWMKDVNSTLYEEICYQIREWIKKGEIKQ